MMTLGGRGAGGGGGGSMSPLTELSGDIAGKLNVLLTDSDDESELSSEGLVREEKLEEIMQELYREITSSSYNNNNNNNSNSTTSFLKTATLTSPSSSSPFPFSSPPLFLAVNDVKSESCGASMSDSSSTVMAGIEFMGPAGNFDDGKTGFPATGNGSTGGELWAMGMGFEQVDHEKSHIHSNAVVGGGASVMDSLGLGLGLGSVGVGVGKEEEKTEGRDEGEGEDQWLARVLGWGPLELEEWT